MKELFGRESSNLRNTKDTIVSRFRKQVAKDGGKIAISWSNGKMDYLELDVLSNQIANILINKFNVGGSDFIAVILPESEILITILIAILKCDATYVAIPPNSSKERKEFILNDISCKLIIDENFIANHAMIFKKGKKEVPKVTVENENIACIIYPYAEKEKPKGVMIKHSNIIALLESCNENFDFFPNDAWLLFQPYNINFPVGEIFGCLLNGGNLVIVSEEESKDKAAVVRLMIENKITIARQTPSQFYDFMDGGIEVLSLRYVILCGESLNTLKLIAWSEKYPKVNLISMYGFTEATGYITFKKVTKETLESSLNNIGKPMSFVKCYILNENQELLPYGQAGELYIAGEGVVYGYLNNPELDAKLFVDNPFSSEGKMYRTGDLVRYLPNGEIEYLGKKVYK